MDIKTFAAAVLRDTQVKKNLSKDIKKLMPRQQKTRSYKDVEKAKPKLNITLRRYYFGEDRNEWTMQYYVQFPFKGMRNDQIKNATDNEFKEFAEDYLKAQSQHGDDKYIYVKRADAKKIIFVFDIDKWFKDNFSSIKPQYRVPMTLAFRYKHDIPLFIAINAPRNDLNNFIVRNFKDWLKKHIRLLKNRNFSFIKKFSIKLFNYKVDYQSQYIIASLKYSVILGALAGYIIYKHKKDLTSSEIKKMKHKVANFGSVKKLDKYLKHLP